MKDKLKILVIDDEKLIVKTTCLLIRHLGYETFEAFTGTAGIAMAIEKSPDLILLDLSMPVMDGWEVLEKLKSNEATSGIPVVIFTVRRYSNAEGLSELRGAVGYIKKPFEPEELETLIAEIKIGSKETK